MDGFCSTCQRDSIRYWIAVFLNQLAFLFSAIGLPQPRLLLTANRGIFYPHLQIQVPGLAS